MNNIVTIKKLAEEIASMTGTDLGTAENFLNEFFATVEDSLAGNESVKIKGIGTFSRNSDTAHPVIFTPDNDFTDAVNTPFEMFSAVDLDDDISDEDLNIEDEETAVEDEDHAAVESDDNNDVQSETVNADEDRTSAESDTETDEITVDDTTTETDNDSETDTVSDDSEETDSEEIEETEEAEASRSSRRTMPFVSGLLLGLAAGFACGWIVSGHISSKAHTGIDDVRAVTDTISDNDAIADSISAPAQESDSLLCDTTDKNREATEPVVEAEEPKAIVTDTVRANHFLTTMARHYYGQMEYWAFIYEANKDKLGHPNRTKPGTIVVIPPIEEIRHGDSDDETMRRAKKLGKEIYDRYK